MINLNNKSSIVIFNTRVKDVTYIAVVVQRKNACVKDPFPATRTRDIKKKEEQVLSYENQYPSN